MASARLAVLGSPIAHSLSPTLHRAAYDRLGLDWDYKAVDMTSDRLARFVGSLDASWRGLSLTMPLKREVIPLLGSESALVSQTGSANTVMFDRGVSRGYNTDVFGITESFLRHGITQLGVVLILGGGATAASALVAARRLGAEKIFIGVRDPSRAADLARIARAQGVELLVRTLDELVQIDEPLEAVISTLPNGAQADIRIDPDVVQNSALFDVAYSPWPTPLAAAWTGGPVIGGLEMLALQAFAQVRIFVTGAEDGRLEHEDEVLAEMLASVGL